MDSAMEALTQWTLFGEAEETPILPYGGTSGWSGTPTSRERAERDDSDGTTSKRQDTTIRLLKSAKEQGLTWYELAKTLDTHHGTASGLLSVLHKSGRIVRLNETRTSETRGKSMIYVLPEYVDGRQTSPYRPNVSARLLMDILEEIDHDLANGNTFLARRRIHQTLETYRANQQD